MARQLAAMAVFLGLAAAAPASDAADAAPTCELGRSDRARTPSTRCLACHDGTAAAALGPSHPVEVDYARAAMRDPRRYVPASALPREITLVNGNVSCASCHDAASPQRAHTAMAGLCQACHRL
jgi:hypothetical protein